MRHCYQLSENQKLLQVNERLGDAGIPFVECPRHIVAAVRLRGNLDVDALRSSLETVTSRHPILRGVLRDESIVISDDDSPVDVAFDRPVQGIGPSCSREEQMMRILHVIANRPFVLESEPAFRYALVPMAASDHVLALTNHHLTFDAWSARVIARELADAYAFMRGTRPSTEVTRERRFIDYVRYHASFLASPAADDDRQFWFRRLAGLGDSRMREDFAHVDETHGAGRLAINVRSDVIARLRDIGRTVGATLAVVILTAFTLLIAELIGTSDVAIGVPVADRPRREFENAVGFFMNALTIRTNLAGDPTFKDCIAAVKRSWGEAFDHCRLPFGSIIDAFGCSNGLGWVPFRFVLNFVNITNRTVQLPGVATQAVDVSVDGPCHADVSLHIREDSQSFTCIFLYKRSRFARSTIESVADAFVNILVATCHAPDARASALSA